MLVKVEDIGNQTMRKVKFEKLIYGILDGREKSDTECPIGK